MLGESGRTARMEEPNRKVGLLFLAYPVDLIRLSRAEPEEVSGHAAVDRKRCTAPTLTGQAGIFA